MIEKGYGPAVRLFEGYQLACDLFHLRPAYCEADLSLQDVFQATTALLNQHPDLTAIIDVHNALVAGVIRALQERSFSIPGDYSVVGMLTNTIARLMTPPLTAVNIPTYDMGYQASKMLIDVLRNHAPSIQQVLLEPSLIVRESSAPRR
jgi:LacI family transcriptional regulator